jgi:hypothetical protein
MTRACVIAGAVLLIAACGQSQPSGQAASSATNVTGVLDRGPVPTCPTDEPCDPPLGIATLIFSAGGGAQVRVPVGGDGRFATHLDPGQYSIGAAPPPFQGRVEPSTVEVPENGPVFLRLHIARPS